MRNRSPGTREKHSFQLFTGNLRQTVLWFPRIETLPVFARKLAGAPGSAPFILWPASGRQRTSARASPSLRQRTGPDEAGRLHIQRATQRLFLLLIALKGPPASSRRCHTCRHSSTAGASHSARSGQGGPRHRALPLSPHLRPFCFPGPAPK